MSIVGAIGRCPKLSEHVAKLVFYSHIQSKIRYLIPVWSQGCKYITNTISILINRAIKILYRLPYDYPTTQLYYTSNLPSVEQTIFLENCKLIYKLSNNLMKSNLKLQTNASIHNYNTRSAEHYRLAAPRTERGKRDVMFNGIKIFNSLPNNIKYAPNLRLFNKRLKAVLPKNNN